MVSSPSEHRSDARAHVPRHMAMRHTVCLPIITDIFHQITARRRMLPQSKTMCSNYKRHRIMTGMRTIRYACHPSRCAFVMIDNDFANGYGRFLNNHKVMCTLRTYQHRGVKEERIVSFNNHHH